MPNYADPNVADALLLNTAAQVNRVYNPGGGLSAQDPVGLPTFAVSRKYNVTSGQTYTASMWGAPTPFYFYVTSSPRIDFFTAAGAFHSSITVFTSQGVAIIPNQVGARQIEFTVPVGAAKVGFNLRNTVEFGVDFPLDAAGLQPLIDTIMINDGTDAIDFELFGGGTPPSPPLNTFVVAIQAGYAYVRMHWHDHPTLDIVWKIRYNENPSYTSPTTGGVINRTAVLDFYGVRTVLRARPTYLTIADFNRSVAFMQAGMDERAPMRINGMYVGSSHGVIGYERATAAAHGLTNANVGSTCTDTAGKVWVLVKIVSTTRVFVVADNTGAIDKWNISTNAPTGATLTWQSGGANWGVKTFTTAVQGQLTPILQNMTKSVLMDGVPLVASGTYAGTNFVMNEHWELPNVARLLAYLKANIGSVDYTNAAIGLQVKVTNEYTWNKWSTMVLYRTEEVMEAFRRSAGSPGDYSGGIQMQRPSLLTDTPPGLATSVAMYVPDEEQVQGYDFKAVADITGNNAFVNISKAKSDTPDNPPSHFAVIARDNKGAAMFGMVWGYFRHVGQGVPATRAAQVTDVHYLSPPEKFYPVAIDAAAGDAVAGQTITIAAFRSYFPPTTAKPNPKLTIPCVIVTDTHTGIDYIIIAALTLRGNQRLFLPDEFTGKNITLRKASQWVRLDSNVVEPNGILASFLSPTGYGDIILELSGSTRAAVVQVRGGPIIGPVDLRQDTVTGVYFNANDPAQLAAHPNNRVSAARRSVAGPYDDIATKAPSPIAGTIIRSISNPKKR